MKAQCLTRPPAGTIVALLLLGLLPDDAPAVEAGFDLSAQHEIVSPAGGTRVLLHFADLTPLQGQWVTSARLRATLLPFAPSRNTEMSLFTVDRDWTGATWTSPWETPGGNLDTWDVTTIPLKAQTMATSVSLDVTDAVRGALEDPGSFHGFLLAALSRNQMGAAEDEAAFEGVLSASLEVTHRKLTALGIQDGGQRILQRRERARIDAGRPGR